ncbi:MAG: SagB/ThcOx family dehydrogenase [Fibromonadaceae bacterium]|jgi:SagB-type dehydrogenase family enzyme|nr:SagB/ThcOx family dehydrogenase [Fibromonadaceae bacterium]
MKILCFLTLAAATLSFAQLSGQNISLPKPNLDKGYSITKSLSLRKSAEAQDFQKAKDLSLEEISDLLWAANGVNRPAEGRRTAPSAMNSQDIYLYVLAKSGAYLYNAKEHTLSLVANSDLRAAGAGGQKAFGDAPIIVLLVSDISKLRSGGEKLGAMDAGIVSQNISLFCSGTGLITRVRASMDVDALTKALKLNASQIPMLNHPVGK